MEDIINFDSTGSIDLYTEFETDTTQYDSTEDNTTLQGYSPEQLVTSHEQKIFDASSVNDAEDITQPLIVNNTEYITDNTEVIEELKKVNENILDLSGRTVNNSVSDNVVSVSKNEIMTKAIQDYNVSESLSLMIFLTMFCAGLVFIIRKGLYKWI